MAYFKYVKLADWLRNSIISENFKNNEKLPTEEMLATQFNVSRHTARKAILILEKEGLLKSIQGSGIYVLPTNQKPKNISKNKTKNIGIIINDFDDYIYPSIIKGINDYLYSLGYSTIIKITNNQINLEEKAIEFFLQANVDGLILEPAKSTLQVIENSLLSDITQHLPCVTIHFDYPELNIPAITVPDIDGFYQLTQYVINKGHRNIISIFVFDDQTSLKRYKGFIKALRDNNIEYDDKKIFWYTKDDLHSLERNGFFDNIFTQVKNATVAMCYNDQLAALFISYLQKRGISVPKDLSITGFDNAPFSNQELRLTTIEHPKFKLGIRACESLLSILDNNEDSNMSYQFDTKLIEGNSVKIL